VKSSAAKKEKAAKNSGKTHLNVIVSNPNDQPRWLKNLGESRPFLFPACTMNELDRLKG
jgi:hypothetical protein